MENICDSSRSISRLQGKRCCIIHTLSQPFTLEMISFSSLFIPLLALILTRAIKVDISFRGNPQQWQTIGFNHPNKYNVSTPSQASWSGPGSFSGVFDAVDTDDVRASMKPGQDCFLTDILRVWDIGLSVPTSGVSLKQINLKMTKAAGPSCIFFRVFSFFSWRVRKYHDW